MLSLYSRRIGPKNTPARNGNGIQIFHHVITLTVDSPKANCDLIVKHEDDREDDNSSQSSFRDVIECWCEEGQSKQDQTARKYTT